MKPEIRRSFSIGLALVACAAAILVPPLAGRWLLLLAGALLLIETTSHRFFASRRVVGLGLLALVLACGWTVYYQPGAPVDLFEDGLTLGPALAYLQGARPYVETYPVHGWGADGGFDALFFRTVGPSLQTLRLRRAAVTALALAALALCAYSLFESIRWAAVALTASLCLCPFVSERQALALGALALLLRAARRERPGLWLWGGVLSGAALFFSLDFGLIALAGGISAGLALSLLAKRDRGRPALCGALWLAVGAAIGALPFFFILARERALGAFFRVSFREIPVLVSETWGLPAGSATLAVRETSLWKFPALLATGEVMPALFLLLLLAAAMTLLLFRAASGPLTSTDRAAAVAVAFAAVALRGLLGRADAGHSSLYGIFIGLAAAWLLYRARRRPLVAAVLLLGLSLRLHPRATLLLEWHAIQASRPSRDALLEQGSRVPRGGGARLPRAQAEELSDLRRYFDGQLSSRETFFDFGNEPGLYFFLERRSPVRYAAVPLYEPPDRQQEVLAALERDRTPLAILSSGTSLDAFDGVASRRRAPLVAAYLDAHYSTVAVVAGRTIARRNPGS